MPLKIFSFLTPKKNAAVKITDIGTGDEFVAVKIGKKIKASAVVDGHAVVSEGEVKERFRKFINDHGQDENDLTMFIEE